MFHVDEKTPVDVYAQQEVMTGLSQRRRMIIVNFGNPGAKVSIFIEDADAAERLLIDIRAAACKIGWPL